MEMCPYCIIACVRDSSTYIVFSRLYIRSIVFVEVFIECGLFSGIQFVKSDEQASYRNFRTIVSKCFK